MRAIEFIIESVEQKLPSLETFYEAEWDQTPVKHYSPSQAWEIHNKEELWDPDNPLKKQSIGKYTGGQGAKWNDFLHRHYRGLSKEKDFEKYQQHIADVDATLSKNTFKKDYVLYTGLKESPADAFDLYNHPRTKPIPVHLPAYTSTTTDWMVAKEFTRATGGVGARQQHKLLSPTGRQLKKHPDFNKRSVDILRIFVPAGTTGGSVSAISKYHEEYEILLPRGLDIIISPKPQVIDEYAKVIYLWNAKVIGHRPQPIKIGKKL